MSIFNFEKGDKALAILKDGQYFYRVCVTSLVTGGYRVVTTVHLNNAGYTLFSSRPRATADSPHDLIEEMEREIAEYRSKGAGVSLSLTLRMGSTAEELDSMWGDDGASWFDIAYSAVPA